MGSQWVFVDPQGNGSFSFTGTGTEDAYLELDVPSGTTHDLWRNSTDAIRVMQPTANEDFELEVKFASEPSQRYQLQGILVEQDSDKWIRFDTYHDGRKLRVFAAVTIDGVSTTKIKVPVDTGTASYLRVNRQGDLWTLDYSDNGTSWTTAGSFTEVLTVNEVGTFAGNSGGSSAPAFTSQVDYFFNTAAPIIPEDVMSSNQAPVANDDTATVDLSDSVIINVLNNDTDSDGTFNLASVSIDSQPTEGTLQVNADGTITYNHTGTETGSDSFTYTVEDNDGAVSNVATVDLTIAEPLPNQAPVANDDTATVDLSDSVIINVLNNDTDSDGTFNLASVSIDSQPTEGTLQVNADGTITYNHTGTEAGSDSFTYTVEDNDGAVSNVATVDLTIVEPLGGGDAPFIDVWYGSEQKFGQIGQPQTWINILGNVQDIDGISSLTYSLNGGTQIPLSIGRDRRRLSREGDFNIDIAYSDLDGSSIDDVVDIFAEDNSGNISTETVTIDYESGNIWPDSYTIDWGSTSDIQDVAQVVDGDWVIEEDTVRTAQPGYDRLIAIGDISWTDYEAIVPITINSPSPARNKGIGLAMRWTGHTDDPIPDFQPKTGWQPLGAIGWYRSETLGISTTGNLELNADDGGAKTLEVGVDYNFKMRVETIADVGGLYSLKVWEVGQSEPSTWDVQYQDDLSRPQNGSLLLLSHKYDTSFGDVIIEPIV